MSLTDGPSEGDGVARYERLLRAALALTAERDVDALLAEIVRSAAEVLGARYCALGTYDADGHLERFVHHGVARQTAAMIDGPPRGRGLLGKVVVSDGPLRLRELTEHPSFGGFPPHHPPMHSFLGVPVRIGSRRFGNLYLTEKLHADEFNATDETLAATLATFAAAALESALLATAERDRATGQAELAEAEERTRAQSAVLSLVIGAQEAERARVARDLHDQIGQALTSVLLGLRLVTDSLDRDPLDLDETKERAHEVRSLVADALSDVRQLAFDLRPTVLDDVGLVPALDRLTADLQHRHHVAIDLVLDGLTDDARLAADVETVVYRVVQEALTNVVRHARARTAKVSLAHVPGSLRATILDDGDGFQVPDGASRSLGLGGMVERAQLVGGRLTITSAVGAGTIIELEVPDG